MYSYFGGNLEIECVLEKKNSKVFWVVRNTFGFSSPEIISVIREDFYEEYGYIDVDDYDFYGTKFILAVDNGHGDI